MPPGQPILRCQGCEALRPCREFDGRWLCFPCSPLERVDDVQEDAVDPSPADRLDDGVEPPTLADGGNGGVSR